MSFRVEMLEEALYADTEQAADRNVCTENLDIPLLKQLEMQSLSLWLRPISTDECLVGSVGASI